MPFTASNPRIRPPSAPLSPVDLLLRLGSLGVFVILLVAVPQFVEDDSLKQVLPAFMALLYLQVVPLFWFNKPDLFEPPTYYGVFAAMTTLSTVQYFMLKGEISIALVSGLSPDELVDLTTTTVWASCLGLIAYYAGYYQPRWGKSWSRLFPDYTHIEWDPGKLKMAAVAVSVVFVLAYAAFQVRAGVPLFDYTKLKIGKEVWRDNPTLSWMLRGAQLGALPVLFYLTLAAKRNSKQFYFWAVALVVVGVLTLRLGQRGFLFNALLAGAVIIHYLKRRIPTFLFVFAFLVAVVAGDIMLRWRTGETQRNEQSFAESLQRPGEALAEHEDDRQRFAAQAVLFKEFPENHDYLLGQSWLAIAVTPIPRWLWPSKGQYFQWRDTTVIPRLVGAPIPVGYLGLLYINFSWFGIVIGMFLWGVFHRALYDWLRVDPTNPSRVLFYTMMLLFFAPTMLGISASLQYVLTSYVIIRYIKLRRRPAVAPAPAS
jgi:hypothetical protein